MEKKKITPEIRKQLNSDFPAKAYKKHPTKTFLTTLKAMYVTERLNDVFGVGRWTIDIEIIERTTDYVLVQGEFRCLDFEVIVPKQYGGHKTSGKGTEIADGFKSALTDCQSKIASYLEIGIEMFKGNINPNNNDSAINNQEATTKPPVKVDKRPQLEITTNGKNNPKFAEIWKGINEGFTDNKGIERILTIVQIRKLYKFTKATETALTNAFYFTPDIPAK